MKQLGRTGLPRWFLWVFRGAEWHCVLDVGVSVGTVVMEGLETGGTPKLVDYGWIIVENPITMI